MIEIEDKEFFDHLYQQWSKTTGAEDTFWMSEEQEVLYPGMFEAQPVLMWAVLAVDSEQNKTPVAMCHNEADADFAAAIHGCLADLTRRLHDAVDEADRLDRERDDLLNEMVEMALERDGLLARLGDGIVG